MVFIIEKIEEIFVNKSIEFVAPEVNYCFAEWFGRLMSIKITEK